MNNHTVHEEFEDYSLGDDYELSDAEIQVLTDTVEVVNLEFSNVDSHSVSSFSDSDIDALIENINFEDDNAFSLLVEVLNG